jgi:hypothetical protein
MNDVLRSLLDVVLKQLGVSLQRDERDAWQPPPARPWLGLAPATLTQRGLAVTAALIALVLAEGGTATWLGVAIALQFGGGVALMGLPRALGWSEAALGRTGPLALVSGLLGMIVATQFQSPDANLGPQLRWGAAGFALLVVVVPPALAMLWPFAARLFGPMLLPAWTAATVFAGALLLLLGATAWPALQTQDARLAALVLALLVAWVASFLVNRFEAGRGYRWAGRLLALRSGLARLGGVVFGLALAWHWVPLMEDAARRVAFGTPLEGWAPLAGVLFSALLAAVAAAAGFALPGLLARWQLGGRLTAAAAGESSWLLALLAVVSLISMGLDWRVRFIPSSFALDGTEFFSLWEQVLPLGFSMGWAVAAHAAVLVVLGRSVDVGGTPLWLVLPGATPSRIALALAEHAGRNWSWGPVSLLAPPVMAPTVRGAHLHLAQQAGALTSVFASGPADVAAASWGAPTAGREGLPAREAYCAAPAARALLAGLPAEARVWVLNDGPCAAAWDEVLRQLPAGAECLGRDQQSVPSSSNGWVVTDFAQTALRDAAWTTFLGRHQPRLLPQRRILVLHGEDNRSLVARLVHLLDGQTDTAGRSVVASSLAAIGSRDSSRAMGWSAKTLGSLVALAAKSDKPGVLASLNRLTWRLFFGRDGAEAPVKPELVVLEDGFDEIATRTMRGLDRAGIAVVALLPAQRKPDGKLLFDESSYSARLVLPPPSALGATLALVAQEILNEATASDIEIEIEPASEPKPKPKGEATTAETAPAEAARANAATGSEADGEREAAAQADEAVASEVENESPQSFVAGLGVSPYGTARCRVFISCRGGEPSLGIAQALRARLAILSAPLDVATFFDERAERAAGDWRQALDEATHFIALLSEDYLRSESCREQLEAAVRRHEGSWGLRLFFIPLNEMPPEAMNLDAERDGTQLGGHLRQLTGLADLNFLGPYDQSGRLVRLAWENEALLNDQLSQLVSRFERTLEANYDEDTAAWYEGQRGEQIKPGASEEVVSPTPAAAEAGGSPADGEAAGGSRQLQAVPVFLSYVADYNAYREPLEDALLARGLDVRSDRGVAQGTLWRQVHAKALEESRILVALAGPATAASTFASAEIETALKRGMSIVPVIVAPFDTPLTLKEHKFANHRFLAELGPEDLIEEIAHTAGAIAKLAVAMAVQDQFPDSPEPPA